jgi:plasmid stabilization system protein ParE
MHRYELSPESVDDLINIQEFVSADSPAAADRMVEKFFSAFEHLATWPRSGHSRGDLTERPVLFWPVGSYLIVYHVRDEDNLVQIVAVLLAPRDVPAILENR